MKINFRQKVKSALSLLLTLCLLLSVMTVGIASFGAAEVDLGEVGATNFVVGDRIYLYSIGHSYWNDGTAKDHQCIKFGSGSFFEMTKVKDGIFYADVPTGTDTSSVTFARGTTSDLWNQTTVTNYSGPDRNLYNIKDSCWSYMSYDTSDDNSVTVYYDNSLTQWASDKVYLRVGRRKIYTNAESNYSSAYNMTKVSGTENVFSYTFSADQWNSYNAFNFANGPGWTNSNSIFQTLGDKGDYAATDATEYKKFELTNGNYYFIGQTTTTTVPGDTGSGCTYHKLYNISGSDSQYDGSAYTTYQKTVSVSSNANAEVTATYTSGSGGTIAGGNSATVLSGSTITVNVTTGGIYSLDNITVTNANNAVSTTIAASGGSTFVTGNAESVVTANLTLSDEPLFCLVGNHVGWGAFLIDGDDDGVYDDEPTLTQPTGTDNWFSTWQDDLEIGKSTGTAGVYSLTFKVKERADYNWDSNICIYMKGVGQKAFVLDGNVYNTSAHGDITITDAGIKDSDNLYAYDLAATTPGGSLKLKSGQTYTITIDQTQRYNSSSPYGKITITASDVFADVAAKKQVFNATSGSYESAVDCEASIGTASAQPVHNAGSLSTTLTATVANANYDFIGWYTNADCTGTPAIAASACTKSDNTYTTSVTISETTEYYALFKQKQPSQYTVTLTQPSYGTISTTGGVSGDQAYQGATVSLNATVTNHSKEFSHWLITNAATNVDITSTVCANPTLQSTTFTMPALNVKVTAIYSNKTQVTITTSSNNNSLGTADSTSGTYYVGDTINISATNVGGVFSRWVVTGGTVANAGSASTTIVATGSTVTARAIFDYKTYQLYVGSKYLPMIRQDDGTYVSTSTVTKGSGVFTVYDASDKKYAYSQTSGVYELHSGWTSGAIYSWVTSNSNYKYQIESSDSATYYVKYTPPASSGNGSVSIVSSYPGASIATVYAKDGSIRYYDSGKSSGDLWEQSTGGPTANRGVTVVTKINSTAVSDPDSSKYPSTNPSLSDHVKIYSAPIGSTITIQTTLNDTYKNQGFYVGMFVINGWKVAAFDAGKGVYTATYTLTDEYAEKNLDRNASFEITPVYYNKNFDYITFYVDADSVPDKWGSTISACADYNGATNAHFEGTYPGQPLGREGDLYELKVAKYYYDYSSTTGKWTAHTNYHPSATITAYNFDLVHHYYYVNASDDIYSASTNDNYQTYDYSDFAYLAQIPNIEAILFRCKYETAQNNWRIFADSGSSAPTANYNATDPTWWAVDAHTSLLNSFEVLTDYYGNPIDAFGNRIIKSGTTYYTADDVSTILSEFSTVATDKIRIVSYGNRKTDDDSANSRTAAQWATGWAVFQGGADGTNRKIAYGNPADFICTTPGTTSTSNVHYLNSKSASDLTGKLTFISYDNEKTNSISGVGDTGKRIDGQWYYSAQHDFDSTVQVHITTATGTAVKTSDTTVDADSSTANTNDGWEGTTSKTVATLDGKTTETYSNVTTEAALNCTLGSGYTFVGWYIYDGSTYTKIGDNFADQNTTMTMKKNYTIVAVVRAVAAGDLVITHSRYTGSKPEAHDGTGKYYVSAVVTHSDSTTTPIAEAQNSITVSGLAATDKLTITIRTVCNGADTFYAWYEEALGANYSRTGNYYEICSETEDPLGESEVSYQFFEADCSTFFNGSTLARNTIDLYSDIVHVSAYATLTYKYYDRFAQNGKNQMVSYVVKDVPLTDEEIDNGYIPTDAKIAQYAPKVVDTIYTDTKWTIAGTKVERAASNVTLMATQTPKTCFVEYVPGEQVGNDLLKGKTTELPVTDIVTWNTRIVDYNSWLIDENADMSNPDESDFYVNAPATYTDETTGKTWTFVRFDVYEYNRLTGEIGDVIYSSNDHTFGYRIYADCVIYPVYTDEELVSKQLTAKIEPAVLNREVYGDSLNPTDKLYADLLISFINVAAATGNEIPEEIKNLAADSGYTIETGFVLDKTILLSDTDFNTLKTAAQEGATDTTDTILTGYISQFNASTAESVAKGTATTGFSKYVLDNAKLTNKNRTDGVVRFSNSETAQKKVYAAYSYIIINNGSELTAFAISDAQLFNFCYLGNKPLEKVS